MKENKKIIFPEGEDIWRYIDNGSAICNKCGALMEQTDDIPPEGCIACGGPYPHCKTSCKLFDD